MLNLKYNQGKHISNIRCRSKKAHPDARGAHLIHFLRFIDADTLTIVSPGLSKLASSCVVSISDYSKTDLTPGKNAITPLDERSFETLQGLVHLVTDRGYDREIQRPLEYLASSDLPSLKSSMCPGYYVNADGVGNRGVVIEVTSEDVLDVASR